MEHATMPEPRQETRGAENLDDRVFPGLQLLVRDEGGTSISPETPGNITNIVKAYISIIFREKKKSVLDAFYHTRGAACLLKTSFPDNKAIQDSDPGGVHEKCRHGFHVTPVRLAEPLN